MYQSKYLIDAIDKLVYQLEIEIKDMNQLYPETIIALNELKIRLDEHNNEVNKLLNDLQNQIKCDKLN